MTFGPTPDERRVVYRCLTDCGELYGSEDDVWGHPNALKALGTLRLCVDAIITLVDGGHAVKASFVKAVVIQTGGLERLPYVLDEMAEFLLENGFARQYWQGMVPDRDFPHRCPHCHAAAFVGFNLVTCKAKCPTSKTR